MEENFPEPWDSKLLQAYPLHEYKPFWAAASALTDYVFKCPTQHAASLLGNRTGLQVFEYNFILDPVGPRVRPQHTYGGWTYKGDPCGAGRQGVAIGFDVMFFLKSMSIASTQYEKDTAAALLQYLRNFAWSGDPNVYPPHVQVKTTLPHWPALTRGSHQKLWIGPPSQGNITVQNDTRGLKCNLWQDYFRAGEPMPGDGDPLRGYSGAFFV